MLNAQANPLGARVGPAFGYAMSAQESAYPHLWQDHVGSWIMAWAPGALRIEDWGASRRDPGDAFRERGGNWPTIGVSPLGRSTVFDGTNYIRWLANTTGNKFKCNQPLTIAAYIKCGLTYDAGILLSDNRAANPLVLWTGYAFQVNAATGLLYYYTCDESSAVLANNERASPVSGGILTANTWHHVGVVDYGSIASAQAHSEWTTAGSQLYLDGEIAPTVRDSSGSPSITAHHPAENALAVDTGVGTDHGDMEYAVLQLWSGIKTHQEMRLLGQDPLAMFRSAPQMYGKSPVTYSWPHLGVHVRKTKGILVGPTR